MEEARGSVSWYRRGDGQQASCCRVISWETEEHGPSLAARRPVQALWTGGDKVRLQWEEGKWGVEVASGGKTF